jgi:hypothetical protein
MVDATIAYNPTQWAGLFSAEVGASAALTGLLFVAVSINLPKIISIPLLTARSAKALSTLVGVLLIATVCMVPGQSPVVLGSELTLLSLLIWIMITIYQRASLRDNPYISRSRKILHSILAQSSAIPPLIAGVSLALGRGGGLYWLVPGILVSFVAALFDTWVLLIEIQR